jgi:hypothetical protein
MRWRGPERNAALNGGTGGRIELVEANAFDFLRAQDAAGERYDTIVIDPPAFAKRKDAWTRRAARLQGAEPAGAADPEPGRHPVHVQLLVPPERVALPGDAGERGGGRGRPVRWLEWRGQAGTTRSCCRCPNRPT